MGHGCREVTQRFGDQGILLIARTYVINVCYRFVKDPRDVVKAGDIVKVRVVEVDLPRKRIALTMKVQDGGSANQAPSPSPRVTGTAPRPPKPATPQTSLGAAFAKLKA